MGQPEREGIWRRMDACVCMAESLHCSPETIITLLIGYASIQDAFGVKNKNKIKKSYETGGHCADEIRQTQRHKHCTVLLTYGI